MDEMISCDADLETETMQQNELAQAGVPEIGVLKQVNLSTLQIIQKLFTEPGNGPAFLAQILRFAEVKQMALPGIEGTADVAVITLQTIRELAKKIQWGYDTTHKYVVVFCALNLLVKRRYEGRIQLLFSLKQYTPPLTSKALDDLINKSRPKVRQFATRVKHRCILYNIIQQEETQQEGHSTLERQLLLQLQSILQDEHVNQAQRQRLMLRISSEIFSKLILPSNTVESLPTTERFASPKSGETQRKVSPHIVDSPVLDLITNEKTFTHESTTAQTDIVTSGSLLASQEEARISSAASLEVESPVGREIEPLTRETFKRESPPTQEQPSMQGRLLEKGKTRETLSNGHKESESTSVDDRAALKEALIRQFSSPASSQSRRRQQPAQIGSIFSHESSARWVDSPAPSGPIRKMATPPQMSREDSQKLSGNESTMKGTKSGDSQTSQEVSPAPVNGHQEDLRNSGVDSQATKQLPEPAKAEKSPIEEKSSEQPEGIGDFSHSEVDFSTITQIHIENYSESFLRAYVTLNVIDFINKNYNNNVNVTSRDELAKFLAEIMDGDHNKWLIHKKLLGRCQPDAIVGALVFVLTRLYDNGGGSIRNKAALFMQRCKEYQADGVPPHIVLLINSLRHYTFEKMISFFKERQRLMKDPRVMDQESPTPVQSSAPPTNATSVYDVRSVLSEAGTEMARMGRDIVVWRPAGGPTGLKKKRHHNNLFGK